MIQDHFGESVASEYDGVDGMFAPDVVGRTADVLQELAGGGRVLELGIGTGRIALPLAARGVEVAGIDLSPAMVRRLRDKDGGDGLEVVVGDFAHARVSGSFSLVYLVFNTIMNLTSQAEQVACFRNAAAHLEPGGRFVVEVMVPDLQRLPLGERFRPFTVEPGRLGFDEYDTVTQGLVSHHYRFDGDRAETLAVPFRYVWPAELDLMAALAGMEPRQRWADWDRAPFTAESRQHVSVWEMTASAGAAAG